MMAETMTMELPAAPSASELIRAAEQLMPLLREHAGAIEDRGQLTPEVDAALQAAGLYRITMPLEFGGSDGTITEIMRVLEALARGDGSAAWVVWAGLGVPAMSAFLPEDGARELFARRDAHFAESQAAMGRAVAVEGGYRVTGRWPFVSGIRHATHAGGTCFVFDGDSRRMGDGGPAVVVPVWPVRDGTLIENWDTTGLRGTGSHDVMVDDLFVPTHRTIDFAEPLRTDLTAPHYINPDNAANVTAAAIALGIAAAAVESFRALAPGKRLANGELLAESALGKSALAEAAITLAEARGYLYETVEMMVEEMQAGTYRDEPWLPRTSLASVRAVDASIAATTRVYRAATTSAIRRSGVLDRALRDLLTLGAHRTVQHVNVLIHGGAGFADEDR